MMATEVTGLVIEAMTKMALVGIGTFFGRRTCRPRLHRARPRG